MTITIEEVKKYIKNNTIHPIENVNIAILDEVEKLTIISQDEDIVRVSINFMHFNIKKSDLLTQLREDKLNKLLDDDI